MKHEIGRRIRELRKAHQPPWSINNLALDAQLDPAQLSRAERGLAGLSLDALSRLAGLLGISLAELVDPEACACGRSRDSHDTLVQNMMQHILEELGEDSLAQCSKAEYELICHQVRSAIEEGVKRGQMVAEREIGSIVRRGC